MAEKRKKRDEKDYENDLASAMIVNATKRTEMLREKTMAAQGAQKDSVRILLLVFNILSKFFRRDHKENTL